VKLRTRDVLEPAAKAAVDLDRVHMRDTLRQEPREDAEAGADLEHDIVRVELGEAPDDAEDVVVDQEVLAELLLRRDVRRPKTAVAFASICAASSAASSLRAAASASTVCTTYAGSFRRPRTACGARYGLSVSARIRSRGTPRAAARSSYAFLYVTLPAKETK
jgi:hypothetical protein